MYIKIHFFKKKCILQRFLYKYCSFAKKMCEMKCKYLLFLNLSLYFFFGCKTMPMSTENTPTLLIGQVVFGGGDYVSTNDISFQTQSTSGIEIALRNTVTYEVLRFPANKNGLFYSALQEGKYWIEELYIKKERTDGAWAEIYTNPSKNVLEIESGKVNDVGTLQWTFMGRRHHVVQLDKSSNTKNEFEKQFPKSNWNTKEWKYTPWTLGENISYYLKSEDGRDSALITIPKNLPIEIKEMAERDMIKRMNELRIQNDLRVQGDTTYYIKSENGLDSISLRIPKNISEAMKREIEAKAKQNMNWDQ